MDFIALTKDRKFFRISEKALAVILLYLYEWGSICPRVETASRWHKYSKRPGLTC